MTQQAFKKLLRDWHPDKNADRVQVCTAVFQFLQKARHLFKSERRWLDWPTGDLSSDQKPWWFAVNVVGLYDPASNIGIIIKLF